MQAELTKTSSSVSPKTSRPWGAQWQCKEFPLPVEDFQFPVTDPQTPPWFALLLHPTPSHTQHTRTGKNKDIRKKTEEEDSFARERRAIRV